jgi:sorbitol-specific phosphotransferase system component IIC
VLFKNHNNDVAESNLKLEKILSVKQINSILYSDPFLKAGFISKLVDEIKINVLYLDLDLLYSGYVVSGILPPKENLALFQPTTDTLGDMLKEILTKTSTSQSLIVVDSLNGLFNMLNRKKNVGKTVASIIMLLTSMAQITNSYVLVASMVRYKKEEGWILSPTGKRLIETEKGKKILLEHGKEGIVLNLLDDSTKLLIPASLIPL